MENGAPFLPASTELVGYSVMAGVFSPLFCETVGLDSPLVMLVVFLLLIGGIILNTARQPSEQTERDAEPRGIHGAESPVRSDVPELPARTPR